MANEHRLMIEKGPMWWWWECATCDDAGGPYASEQDAIEGHDFIVQNPR